MSSNTAEGESCLIGKDMKLPVWTEPTAAGALLGSNCLWNFGLLHITAHINFVSFFFRLDFFHLPPLKEGPEINAIKYSSSVRAMRRRWGPNRCCTGRIVSFGILCPRGPAEPRESPSGSALLWLLGSRLSPFSPAPGSRGTPSSCVK